MQANISSVDVSFTSVEVQLSSLSLCRNAAAAALPPSLFTPGCVATSSPSAAAQGLPPEQAPLHPHHSISAPALTSAAGLATAASEPALAGSPYKAPTSLSSSQGASPLRPHHSRSASGSLAGLDLLHSMHSGASLAGASAGSAAAAAVVVHYHTAVWDEVLGLHPLDAAAAAGAAAAAPGQPPHRDSHRAVHVRWQGGGGAAPVGAAAGAAASAADGPGQRCAVHLGQLFVCWAPGFATSVVLLVQPSLAAFSPKAQAGASEAQDGSSEQRSSDAGPRLASANPNPSQAASSAADISSSGNSSGGGNGTSGSGSSPLAAVLSGVVLEAHVGLLQLGLLSSQGSGAAGVVLGLSQIQVRRT